MKYDLIFYISKKTGYCEKRLRSILKGIDAEPNRVVSATSPVELGEEVTHSLRICPLVMIVGGLRSMEDDNLENVLSRVFSNSTVTLDNIRRITAGASVGYIIRCKNQILLALPDDPDDIEAMLSNDLLKYIEEKIG